MTMNNIQPVAKTLKEASILLDGYQALTPDTPAYKQFYVERPQIEGHLIREVERAERGKRAFQWYFTGHTGSGKSTELSRIIADPRVTNNYLPILIDLENDFDIHSIEYTDLILAMGKGCVSLAGQVECEIPGPLEQAINKWGAEIFSEEEMKTRTEGRAGLKASLVFLTLGEEIRTGGEKRKVIRESISTKLIEFIRLIDELASELLNRTRRRVLCVLDGLDHVDEKLCFELLNNHINTITRPEISKIIVIPLPLLNTALLATIERNFSTVPNIKVFDQPGSDEIDPDGFAFYKDAISRYVSLDFFAIEALDSLFRLSAGIVRDMIRNTGNACAYALEAKASRVSVEQAEKVWNETIRFYRSQLKESDYHVLDRVVKAPNIQGIDGVPSLLHSKAIVFYPDGEGWYGVHPAVCRML